MLELAVIVSLSVLFIHATMGEEMIFSFVRNKLYDQPMWIRKPLYECPICMSPWYGSVIIGIGAICEAWRIPTAFEWLMILAIAGGLNTAIIKMGKE